MRYELRIYDSLSPQRGTVSYIEARCNTEAEFIAEREIRKREHEIRQRAAREWAWTKRELKQRQNFVLQELAFLMVTVGRV